MIVRKMCKDFNITHFIIIIIITSLKSYPFFFLNISFLKIFELKF